MYGSILNQVEPSVNLYSQTTRPSSYYGIWTTTLGVNQVTFVKDLNLSTVQKYDQNVMIIKQLDNKNKYKTKLIRTMQIDENSDIYFSGCTINNGQANQIYYGTGYSWVLVNNEYTPPSGGGGGLSYNLYSQETEPDTYDGIWTTKLGVDSLEFTDKETTLLYDTDMNITGFTTSTNNVVNGDILYVISGTQNTNSNAVAKYTFDSGYILMYSMITKKYIGKLIIPGISGLINTSVILVDNKIYIIGGRYNYNMDDASVSNEIIVYDIVQGTFSRTLNLPVKLYNTVAHYYDNKIYIFFGNVVGGGLSTNIYIYNILSNTYTTIANSYTATAATVTSKIDSTNIYFLGIATGADINRVFRFNLLNNTWNAHKYMDLHITADSTPLFNMNNKDYIFTTHSNSSNSVALQNTLTEVDLINDSNYELHYNNSILDRVGYEGMKVFSKKYNKLYLIGGYDDTSLFKSIIIFDIATSTYITSTATTPINIYASAYCYDENDTIYVFAGRKSTDSAAGVVYDAFKYNIATNTVTVLANLPKKLCRMSAVYYNNFIYIFGGMTSDAFLDNSAYRYNCVSNSYTTMTDLPENRACYAATNVNNRVYIFGGKNSSKYYTKSCIMYDINTNAYISIANLNTDILRYGSSAVYYNNSIYLLGYGKIFYIYDITNNIFLNRDKDATITNTTTTTSYSYIYDGYIYGFGLTDNRGDIMKLKLYNTPLYNTTLSMGWDISIFKHNNKAYIVPIRTNSYQVALSNNVNEIGLFSLKVDFNLQIPKRCSKCIIIGSKMYVIGGNVTITVHEYDLLTSSIPKLICSEVNLPKNSTTLLYNNKLHFIGGYNTTYLPTSTDLYNRILVVDLSYPAGLICSTAFNTYSNNETKRKNHCSVVYDKYAYSVGGYTLEDNSTATNTLIRIDLSLMNGTATTLAPCTKDLVKADAICIGSKIYVLFGYTFSTASYNSDILVYDIITNTWSTDLSTSISLINHKVVLRGNDIFIVGGENNEGLSDKVYRYSINTKELTEYLTLPFKISEFALAYYEDEDVGIIAGGVIGDSSTESGYIYKLNFNCDTNLPTVGNIMVMSQVDGSLNHDTKLIEGSNMKVKFTDVYISSEEPYSVYKGDGTSWIKFR